MIPRIHAGGRGVGGLLAYITHDPPSAGKRRPTTDERVGLVAGLNLPTDDPHLAGLIMARTAADAEAIKELAGTSSRGRKLKAPFSHLSLSWSPDEPRPDRGEMRRATEEALKSIGMHACQALVVEHTDTAHPHVHVAVCRVDPETGKACGRKNDARKLSAWAAKYERSRERIQVPNRIARGQAREEYRAVVDVQVDAGVPVDEASMKARAVVPLPPMQAKRGAGRAARTPAERQDWTAHFKAQVQTPTPADQARRERVQLARTHRRRRRRQKVLAPLTKLKLWKRAPDTTPGRTEPTAKATTARIAGPSLPAARRADWREARPDQRRVARRRGGRAQGEARRPAPATHIRAREHDPASAGPARRSRRPSVTTGPPSVPCGPPPATLPRPAMPSPTPPARRPAGRPIASAAASSAEPTSTPPNAATRPAMPSSPPRSRPNRKPTAGSRRATAGATRRPTSSATGRTAGRRPVNTARHVAGCGGSGSV